MYDPTQNIEPTTEEIFRGHEGIQKTVLVLEF